MKLRHLRRAAVMAGISLTLVVPVASAQVGDYVGSEPPAVPPTGGPAASEGVTGTRSSGTTATGGTSGRSAERATRASRAAGTGGAAAGRTASGDEVMGVQYTRGADGMPVTGTDVAGLAGLGLIAVGVGYVARRLSRQRSTTPVADA